MTPTPSVSKEETEVGVVARLLSLGWKWGLVCGHGTDEPAQNGEYIIADLEKKRVLIPPQVLFEKPIKYDEYF